jgi:hypothetical protein
MITIYLERGKSLRFLALLMSAILSFPLLTSCGGGSKNTAVDQPPRATTQTAPNPNTVAPKKPGLSTAQKVGITLVGAAALYYLYRQHQKSQEKTGPEGQYYLSKNGGVYYRDAQGKPHFVKPPTQPIQVQVPQSEAQEYSQYQGYDGRNSGRTFGAAAQ